MGSPLGPLMVKAFMCNIEEQLTNQNKLPTFYKRYVLRYKHICNGRYVIKHDTKSRLEVLHHPLL